MPRALDIVHEGFQFSDGDLILHESRSTQSAVIKAVTRSRYSHVGLVFGVREGRPYVLEAVQPVRSTPLPTWIRRGREGHFVVARLSAGLDTQEVEALRREAEKFIGRDYDGRFDWSDERIYCSELVWKAYERALGIRLIEPETWRSLDLSDSRASRLAKDRLGRMPEPDALVVTPARLLESPLLVLIGEEASDRRAVTRGRFGHR